MREIARGASAAFVLKGLSAAVTFGLYVVVGRLLGPADAGYYFLALTVVTIASVLGRFGLDNSVLRFVAAYEADQDWAAVKGVYRKSARLVAVGSLCTSAVVFTLAEPISVRLFQKPELAPVLRWMSLAVFPAAMLNLQAQALQGRKRIAESSIVANLGVPAGALLGALLLAPRYGTVGVTCAYSLASIATAILGWRLWVRSAKPLRAIRGHFDSARLLQSCVPLFWVACLQLVITWTSNVVLGFMGTASDLGIYGVANRSSLLIAFVLMAVNTISAPKFAALHQQGDIQALGLVARKSARLMAVAASPLLALFVLAPHFVMSMFGPRFVEGGAALAVLAIGQFINVVTGSVGWILIMCGYERLLRNNLAVSAAICVGLNLLLVPRFGYLGAAVATAVTLLVQMLVAAVMVWYKLGIVTVPIGLRIARTRR